MAVNAHTNATSVALMEEGDIEQKQVVGPCQDFTDTLVLEEDIVQFKLEELARPGLHRRHCRYHEAGGG